MNAHRDLLPYPPTRALEDVTYSQDATPTGIFSLLLPVRQIGVRATVTSGEDYELIDRYLERGIASGGLRTLSELAAFYGLDEVVVDRALRFLGAIGHLTGDGSQLALTEIGYRSVQDGKRYVIHHEDRRILYFDAFGSRPLPAAYYDTRTVKLVPLHDIGTAEGGRSRFKPLFSWHMFRPEALADLARNPRRAYFNLPEGVGELELLDEGELVHLPLYAVRAVGPDRRIRFFCYTPAGQSADPDVGEIVEQTPEIIGAIQEETPASPAVFAERARRWLSNRKLSDDGLAQLGDGRWRVTLPGSSFGTAEGKLKLSQLGSFVVLDYDILHIWCADAGVRHQALLSQADEYLKARVRPGRAATEERVSRIAGRLGLETIDLPRLRHLAVNAGLPDLAGQLSGLI